MPSHADTEATGTPVPAEVSHNGDGPAAAAVAPGSSAGGRSVVRRPAAEDRDPARFRRRRRRLERVLAWTTPVALLLLWQVASEVGWLDDRFFPAPTTIWDAGVELFRDGQLTEDALTSFRRVLWGFVLGCGLGILCGIPLGLSRLARAATEPLVYALWTVPKLALLPLLLLIFGLNEKPIIVLILINCYFLVLIPTMAAIRSVPHSYREAAMSFRATRWDLLRHVMLPAALPQIFVALRLAAGASILVMVGAEFVQGRSGLGFLIWNSWSLFLADRMYVGIVVVAVSGALFTLLIAGIGRRLTPWDTD